VLVRDQKTHWLLRERAAEVLGQLADARVLPALERMAQEDKSQDVRRAAQQAIKWIRQRTG